MDHKTCTRCGADKPLDDYYKASGAPDGHKTICKDCWAAGAKPSATSNDAPATTRTRRSSRTVPTDTGYIADRKLVNLIAAAQNARLTGDGHPFNLMFLGPSGSGKSEAARDMARRLGLPFTKVDAPSMVDPESWFGTREIVAMDGVAITTYRPSEFVIALSQPGVLFIDEINRIDDAHRQILLPILDGSHQVTNPLNGEIVAKHPECYVVMAGNRGLAFTGTYPVDPALMTRSVVHVFDYLDTEDEIKVAIGRTGCDDETARLFVRFQPISTREVLYACALVAAGLDADTAADVVIINGINDDGGEYGLSKKYRQVWTGIRPAATAQ